MDATQLGAGADEIKVYCPHADLTIEALDWRGPKSPERLPIVWLHGWLDNAASFTPLIPLLGEAGRCIAIDFPGHGHSSWLAPRQPYQLWESSFILSEYIQLLLGADQPYLLAGHSMGAAIAPLLAGVASDPDEVGGCKGLILIDGCGPFFATDDIRERFVLYRQGLSRLRSHRRKTPHVYPSIDAAVLARLTQSDMTEAGARLIVTRGLRAVPGGFVFRHDPKLRLPTAQRFGAAQVLSFFRHIHCPVLMLAAGKGLLDQAEVAARAAEVADWEEAIIPGGHHFHMDAPEPTARAIDSWLARKINGSSS